MRAMRRSMAGVWIVASCALLLGVAGCMGVSTTTDTTGSGSASTAEGVATTTADDVVASTSTTESAEWDLEPRVEAWVALLAAVKNSPEDKTEEIAEFLWPEDEALKRAADYQQGQRADPDPANPVAETEFKGIVRVGLAEDAKSATVLSALALTDRDGTVTQGLQVLTWTRQGGIWYRTAYFEPPPAVPGGSQPIDSCILFDNLSWSIESVSELTRLVSSDESKSGEVFLVLHVHVRNDDSPGSSSRTPSDYAVVLYDEADREFAASSGFDTRFPAVAGKKQDALNPGVSEELVYCFEVGEGLDLSELRFEIRSASY